MFDVRRQSRATWEGEQLGKLNKANILHCRVRLDQRAAHQCARLQFKCNHLAPECVQKKRERRKHRRTSGCRFFPARRHGLATGKAAESHRDKPGTEASGSTRALVVATQGPFLRGARRGLYTQRAKNEGTCEERQKQSRGREPARRRWDEWQDEAGAAKHSLEAKLNKIRFGYEDPAAPASSTWERASRTGGEVRYVCRYGHKVRAECAGCPAARHCPTCLMIQTAPETNFSRRMGSIETLWKLAEERNGKLVGSATEIGTNGKVMPCSALIYRGITHRYRWQCEKGHEWDASAHNVKRGSWCPRCRALTLRMTIQDMHELAHSLSGKCLSTEYKGSQGKLLWECDQRHTFWLAPNNIRRSYTSGGRKPSWCPTCARIRRQATKAVSTKAKGNCASTAKAHAQMRKADSAKQCDRVGSATR
ncbi:hypothetical protein FVE85_3727 [Porphyridium purpureum]|uniref:Zinc-ribbon domain-containing protein n=1 Tax=Porphyridium purpureum TaxID=35688 RepID=A0A5J4YLD2_PORPP|nr:hypothetical protein FVE85_3727 [Porphyridium purpureum]|eukprot:POR5620..scf249_10